VVAVATVLAVALPATFASGATRRRAEGHDTRGRYLVYWDQNEEEDMLRMPSARQGRLIPPWDPNGQLCVLPDGSGRFVVGYNPTVPSQHNPGSLLPLKHPPVGEALYTRHGRFTGTTLHVPGPFDGGDIPPDNPGGSLEAGTAEYNANGTMTGCAIDRRGNVFASDLGTAQGQFPPPDDGRVIEWFAPAYDSFCVVVGPTAGGVGPHHVDGTGGLRQPGDLAFDPRSGDLMVPEAGSPTGGLGGRVLRLLRDSLPRSAHDCGPDGLYPRAALQTATFVQSNGTFLPFPVAIARDRTCRCWAVSSVIGDPSIAWLHDDGSPTGRSISGQDLAHVGSDPDGANPFGIAFAPDGTLYAVDIHIQCSAPLVGCGPTSGGGRVLRYTFDRGTPARQVLAQGYDFPTSVTVCVPHEHDCPSPERRDRG
jgi:hypothetical protein